MSAAATSQHSFDDRVASTVARWADEQGFPAPNPDQLTLQRLVGDASYRVYVRATLAPDLGAPATTAMAMVLPEVPVASEEIGGGGPSERPVFLDVRDWLAERGLPVPEIFCWDEAAQVVLLEDLGDLTFERRVLDVGAGEPRLALYREAIDRLIEFQCATDGASEHHASGESGGPAFLVGRAAMDRALMQWELDHYVEWRLVEDLGHPPALPNAVGEPRADALQAAFAPLLDALEALPTRLAHRDFQSRNLMATARGLVLIDFQDALVAPFVYDLVALLRDSYIELPPEEVAELVGYYAGRARSEGLTDLTAEAVARAFHLQTVQRKLKDTGRFVFIDRKKGNPSFLRYRAPSMCYVRDALAALGPEWAVLRSLLDALDPPPEA
jgi:aminoglycoside/choline kinase family phosphotransferase